MKGKGRIEIRENSISGPVIGQFELKSNKKEESQELLSIIKKMKGKKDIYLKFSGSKAFKTELDYFKFED